MSIFLITVSVLLGQNRFAKAYGGTNTEWAHSVIQTSDGGYAVAGWTQSFGAIGPVGYDFLILKLTSAGDVAWVRKFGSTNDDLACSIIQTTDGGYAVAGWTGHYNADSGPSDFVVMKLSSTGNLQWTRIFGGTGRDEAWSIVQTADGGYAVAGTTNNFGAGGYDFLVLKLNSSGGLDWARTFGGTGYERTESIIQTTDGGFAIAGMTNSFGAGSFDFLVLKITSAGGVQWARTYGGAGRDEAYSIVETADRDYAVAGFADLTGAGNYEFAVLRLNPAGGALWTRLYGGNGNDRAHSIVRTTDGGFAVAGWTTSFGSGNWDFLVFKITSSGTLSWARTFGGTGDDRAESVIQTNDGGFAVVGGAYGFGAGSQDFLVLKLMSDGNYPGCVAGCNPTITIPSPSTSSPSVGATCSPNTSSPSPTVTTPSLTITDACLPLDLEERNILPNPGITCSSLPGGALFISPAEMSLMIYAADGRLAYSVELMKGKNRVSLESGVYLWRAENFKGKLAIR